MSPRRTAVERAARLYLPQGRIARGLARGKLRHDPAYAALLDRGLASASRVVDLGCGRGYLFALLLEAVRESGRPAPDLVGVEVSRSAAAVARDALGTAARILEADLATAEVPPCDAAVLLDVLHYLAPAAQDRLLDRVRSALSSGGRVFVRDADAAGGAGFLAVRLSERLLASLRGAPLRRFHYRSSDGWRASLERLGFEVTAEPMGGNTPFANVLLEARAGGRRTTRIA